ncbi:transposase [Yokenella regensburgei]|uniref:transposase n=1 Tax=Yokenella regensburgei TaxID=158877 RepID=UPI003F190245
MANARFTEEQIAAFLQQAKGGTPGNELCEKYGFSMSTLRRWEEQHARRIRGDLKKMETTASFVFLGFLVTSVLLALIFSKAVAIWTIPLFLVYCVSYICRYRALSAKHIKIGDTFLARSGVGTGNAFYMFSWTILILVLASLGYGLIRLIFE